MKATREFIQSCRKPRLPTSCNFQQTPSDLSQTISSENVKPNQCLSCCHKTKTFLQRKKKHGREIAENVMPPVCLAAVMCPAGNQNRHLKKIKQKKKNNNNDDDDGKLGHLSASKPPAWASKSDKILKRKTHQEKHGYWWRKNFFFFGTRNFFFAWVLKSVANSTKHSEM